MQHSITINDREITMSYGLLNELASVVPDIEQIPQMSIDNDLRNQILIQILSERDEKGRITEQPNLFTMNLTTEQVLDLLDWAGAHLMDFFLTSYERVQKIGAQSQERLTALTSTLAGGQASPSKKRS